MSIRTTAARRQSRNLGLLCAAFLLCAGCSALFESEDGNVCTGCEPTELTLNISDENDDAGQDKDNIVSLDENFLEIGGFSGPTHYVGLRYTNVALPPGSTISEAHLQFTSGSESQGYAGSIGIRAESIGNAPAFVAEDMHLSNRSLTGANVTWTPPEWLVLGDSGDAQKSPSLAEVLQEVADRPDWESGNALVIMLSGSTARRRANAFNSGGSPVLHIRYTSD